MRRVLVGIVLTVLAVLGTVGVASAQTPPATPQPYGGQLEQMDPGDEVSSEQVLEVGMLTLGTVNGLAFVVAMVASRLRGPTTAQTRRALISRTGAGTVSESRRARRRPRGGVVPVGRPVAPQGGVPPHAPVGVVPEQMGPAAPEGLIPAARAVPGPSLRPAGAPPAPASPPAGVRSPVRH
ncbi:hypothetical protein [Actinomycetospora termitidis]|uniref:Uncharacterized protein n=1 Tax=Actinomycetospora termitidis TaxID=3053470 RepID=A0ABT7M4X6_9PSEU|nr:hypothetical protein [Actinomycetospora sp. Odt1-22]MDL5155738.1 hypothetical protein [Actinomycetospora sp. Odt1-22]